MRSELDTIEHVLRGALNTILLNLQLLSTSTGGDDRARPLIERASDEVRRLATTLLPAAMQIMTVEVGERRGVDAGELVEQICAEHGLEPSPSPPVPPMLADPALLVIALTHLVSNAVAATPAGAPAAQVSVGTAADNMISVVVRNVCATAALPLAADGTPAGRHLGGVATAMRIARLHGGSLTYEHRDRSLAARLSIPAAPAGSHVPRTAPQAPDEARRPRALQR